MLVTSFSTVLCNVGFLNPLPEDKNLDWSKLKQIADHILNCILDEK